MFSRKLRNVIVPAAPAAPRRRGALGLVCAGASLAACSGRPAGEETLAEVSADTSALYVASTRAWPSSDIPVCWEDPGSATEKQWVREALSGSWEAEGNVNFTGFGACNASSRGIRIRVADEWPHTKGLGTQLDNLTSGMVLNFTFNFTEPDGTQPFAGCTGSQREHCVRVIAVHEFGHALGFAHEHNRADTPATCTKAPQGSNGDKTIGQWDLMSVMNYCNPTSGNDLSATDVRGLQEVYGGRTPISAVAGAPGRLDVAARGTDQKMTMWNWNGAAWSSLLYGGVMSGEPNLVVSGPSQLYVFRRGGNGRLYAKELNGSWVELGPDVITGNPVGVSRAPGLVDVFFRLEDGFIYARSFDGVTSSGLRRVGAPFNNVGGPKFIGTPAVISRGPNQIEVFARAQDQTLHYAIWLNGSWAPFTQLRPEKIASNPAAVSWSPSRVDVFVRGTDDALYDLAWDGTQWVGYVQVRPNAFTGDPAVASWGPGRLDVFVRGTDGALYTVSWDGWQWVGYVGLGSNVIAASPTAVSWGSNRLDVFVRGTDNQLYTKGWDGSQWVGYVPLGGSVH